MSSALDPVSAAIYTALNVSSVTNLAATVTDDLPASPTLPCVLFEVNEQAPQGFGGGGVNEISVRTHVFANSLKDAQTANKAVVDALNDASLTIAGWTQAGRVVWQESISLPSELLNGVKVHEVVSNFTLWCEE